MGSTAKGFPYPDPTDAVANGDLAIKALAQYLEDKHPKASVSGTVTITVTAATTGNAAVVFPVGKFAAAPKVTLGVIGSSVFFAATTGGPTTSGFTAQVRKYDGVNVTTSVVVHWQAELES